MILFLFTSSYPYDFSVEQTFLGEEIHFLKAAFDRVILVPRECSGRLLALPKGVELDESFARLLKQKRAAALIRGLCSRHFFADIFSRPSILLHKQALIRLIKFAGKAELTRQWVEGWLARTGVNAPDCMFYTYWFEDSSMGIGLAKRRFPAIRVVSRAHGYDLYEERHDFPYWPCRRASLRLMERVFPDSEAGLRYLKDRYPEHAARFQTAHLGVAPAGFSTSPSQDGAFRIVSCSMLVPVKRIGLLLEGIACAARQRPQVQFHWYHFGNGDERETLQARANTTFPPNAHGVLPGYSTQADLFRFYRENPLDVFVNVSASEGTPVAVMEAVSCGIPVIAAAVGGNTEIITEQNGILLPPNPLPGEIASALLEMQASPGQAAQKGKAGYLVWQEKYNSESNFRNFAETLRQMRAS